MTPSVVRQIGGSRSRFWRNPAAGLPRLAPGMFLVVFIAIRRNETVGVPGGEVCSQYYVPSIAFGVISACYTNLAFTSRSGGRPGSLKRSEAHRCRRSSIYSGSFAA